MSATVFVTLQAASPYFAEGQYSAPAGEAFTLKITNSMFTLKGRHAGAGNGGHLPGR